jgi:hypothetical protein
MSGATLSSLYMPSQQAQGLYLLTFFTHVVEVHAEMHLIMCIVQFGCPFLIKKIWGVNNLLHISPVLKYHEELKSSSVLNTKISLIKI